MTSTTVEPSEETEVEFLNGSEFLTEFKPMYFDWKSAFIVAKKNLKLALRYPANLLIWGIMPVMWFAPFILMATAIAGPETSTHFTELSGFDDYITFSIIGWFVIMFLDNSIWGIGNSFRWEQFSGTLEPLFMAPVPRVSLLLGAAFSDSIQAVFQTSVLLGLSTLIFGPRYAWTQIAPIVIILLVMIVALYGFGFMVAGLIIVFKDPSVLTQLVSEVTWMVSPVQYPIQALPGPVRFAAYLVPTTLAIITIRELAITGIFNLVGFLTTLGGLALVALLFWSLGLGSFKYAEKWSRQRGHMGGF
ncbi:MAG: ABC transporter permease [Candidatus Hodarchaeota archaeon]